MHVTKMLVLGFFFFVIMSVNQVFKGEVIKILDILGYILGLGFVIFGICALCFWGYEIYKIISKSNKKVSYKGTIYFAILAVICGLVLIIMANVI
ncbi:hypothetical protein ACVDHH_14310 [Staphylococcus saprophyticus]